ncbi:hypothetical protein F3Y22_tig00116973pilonHSYRG00020 [Hibiscus syriacus]|uniref:Uncharacterized protein n=1 Tax=Hibiscus syriacus TaxID=106335 RepID=A0A6A2X840_HIBSY|nr:uncharacterized protein LOC120192207 [Hibiscus syriacus]KAE8658236.1 hypothetical protein F3Y22_tig00116973pilonHSYRG00020 [Hibiscus syriacus]
MGVAVLKPEDCLKLPNPMKHHKNHFPNPNRRNRAHSNRRNRSPTISPTPPSADPKVRAKNLVMGQVKILKRGEELKKPSTRKSVRFEKENVDVDLGSTNLLGPDPWSIPTQTRLTESNNRNNNKVNPVTFYAGSAFITSPPPSSVPKPAFFTKKIEVSVKNSDATSDLRRMLRLDL